ncbi:hypothetical protein METH_14835 [Leisingera methylohalidivorans DSM 14336]|uniref:Uncharacterized protein n=1 Tax=Leisingera methylohalidivorans DSM 14336 TaxID=999552 RepID=V9W1V7_9RHOB|nr:hypothetical protein METH_14835 [Leisingera methylohalidivorans DSM 14336]
MDRVPLDHAIGRKGRDLAYKDFHFLGLPTRLAFARLKCCAGMAISAPLVLAPMTARG